MDKIKLIVDTDPAIGIFGRDVDDGLALLFLLASKNISIEGITINFGNTSVKNGYKVAKKILKLTKREDIPILKGATSKKELGKSTEASSFIIKKITENPEQITILALAPLTNLATSAMLEKNILNNAKEIVIMGGFIKHKAPLFFEFNFCSDYNSANFVLSSPVKKTVITTNLCSKTIFSMNHYKSIKCNNKKLTRFLKRSIFSWLFLNFPLTKTLGFYPWDVVASAYVSNKSLFDNRYVSFISLSEKGKIKVKNTSGSHFNFHKNDKLKRLDMPLNVPLVINKSKFEKLFISRINSL